MSSRNLSKRELEELRKKEEEEAAAHVRLSMLLLFTLIWSVGFAMISIFFTEIKYVVVFM